MVGICGQDEQSGYFVDCYDDVRKYVSCIEATVQGFDSQERS